MNYSKQYAEAVLSGEIVAGKKIQQACKRTLKDLNRKRGFPYYFDEDAAQKAITFVEAMPAKDGSPLQLELFQKWLISELFGWRCTGTGNRRYDRAFISMARKSGKSFLVSCLGALYLLRENSPAKGREIIFTANSNQQAHLAFDMMASGLRQVARVSPGVNERVKINRNEIRDLLTDSIAQPLASDLHSLDGYQSDLAVIDEYALARSDEIVKTLKSGQINSDNSLLAIISTSGGDLNSPMYREYKFVKKILSGTEKADRYFVAIWEQDNNEEAFDHSTWEKSNPLLANKERAATMIPSLQADVDLYSKQGNMRMVQVKNFNRWQSAKADGYLLMDDWDKQTTPTPDIKGKRVYIGLDLSKTSDLTAISWLVPMPGYMFADSHSFVGTKYGGIAEKSRRDAFDYEAGAKRNECTITRDSNGMIDYSEVLDYLLKLIEVNNWQVEAIAYDPYAMDYLIPELNKRGFNLIGVRQGTRTLGIPTIRFRDELYNGKIRHADNQLLTYAAGNAILKYDANNNPIIDKTRNATKIDPLAALMDAYTVALDTEVNIADEADNAFYASDDFGF